MKIMKKMLACCKLYISESRNILALEAIEKVAQLYPDTVIINKFRDNAYNRVGYTLVSEFASSVSSDACSMRTAVFEMVNVALAEINLELHSGTHPRLGVIDHICFHPLAQASMNQTSNLAKSVAADIGSNLQVPIFLYGAAHEEGRSLDSIRRELGYFKPNAVGNQWVGGSLSTNLQPKPDEGPSQVPRTKGIMVIGATRWVDNYNVPISPTDMTIARRIARKLSGRRGGLVSVQAMALAHGEKSIEIACNLLEVDKVGADRVQQEVEALAEREGLIAGKGYFTDLSQDRIVEDYLKSALGS